MNRIRRLEVALSGLRDGLPGAVEEYRAACIAAAGDYGGLLLDRWGWWCYGGAAASLRHRGSISAILRHLFDKAGATYEDRAAVMDELRREGFRGSA